MRFDPDGHRKDCHSYGLRPYALLIHKKKNHMVKDSKSLFRHIRNRPGVVIFTILFISVIVVCRNRFGTSGSVLLAFDLSSFVFLATTMWTMAHSNINSIRSRAEAQKEGRSMVLLASMAVSIVSVVALSMELHSTEGTSPFEMFIAAVSLLLAWSFFNTVFALHYAHVFHDEHIGSQRHPLTFPETPNPGYGDFMYFAFVIGMTFQVSDVQITKGSMRKDVLMHSIIAFVFNVMVIGLTVNVLGSQR
jgi:uncharacterized membrane protein